MPAPWRITPIIAGQPEGGEVWTSRNPATGEKTGDEPEENLTAGGLRQLSPPYGTTEWTLSGAPRPKTPIAPPANTARMRI